MHDMARRWVERWGSEEHGAALDVGGQEINGNARGAWPWMKWTVLDLNPLGATAAGADRVIHADASVWVPDRAYDVVLSTELLEHTPKWKACVTGMTQALEPGGLLVITCAGPGRERHPMNGNSYEPGEHYANVEAWELGKLLLQLGMRDVVVDYHPHACDTRARARAPRG
jgi:hypothetical protein